MNTGTMSFLKNIPLFLCLILTVIAGHFIYDSVRNTYAELKQNTQLIQALQKQVADLKAAKADIASAPVTPLTVPPLPAEYQPRTSNIFSKPVAEAIKSVADADGIPENGKFILASEDKKTFSSQADNSMKFKLVGDK